MNIQDIFQKALSFLVMGIMLTLGLKIGYNNIFTIAFFSLSVIYAIIYRPKVNFRNPAFWFFIGWFCLNALSALFSNNELEAWHRMEVRLMFLLIPFPILVLATFKKSIQKYLSVFVVGIGFLTLILLLNNVFKLITTGDCQSCFFHDFTALYRQHAVYYSMLLVFAGIIILETSSTFSQHLQKFEFNRKSLLDVVILILISAGLFFAASKIMIALWGIYLMYFIFFKSHNTKLKIGFALVVIIGIAIVATSENLRHRFTDGLDITNTDYHLDNRQFTYAEKTDISDMELRFLLAKIGLVHLKEDHKMLTGYGLGDQQDWFDYHLMRYNLAPNWYQGHNVHNQYLDVLLNLGIFGLAFLVVFLVYILYLAWKNKHTLSILVFLIFLIAFLFEVYLSRNKGIVFFTIWTMLFYTFYLNKSKVTLERKNK